MSSLSHRIAIARRFSSRIAASDAVFQTGASDVTHLPYTVSDGEAKQMSGSNLFVLLQVMKDRSWTDPRFFTVAQAQEAGWSIPPSAVNIRLQFLASTGSDGLPLETPVSREFQVFNAGEIDGVPELSAEAKVDVNDVEKAAERSGFVVGLDSTIWLSDWLQSLQKIDSVRGLLSQSDVMLRVKLATCLLEVQTGLSHVNDQFDGYAATWVKEIKDDPLSFFQAVSDAEKLVATVMVQVLSVAQEREVDSALVKAKDGLVGEVVIKGDADMMRKNRNNERIARLFLDREAVLAVPFADKDRASKLGAVWSPAQKLWFIPKGLDVALFNEWDPRAHALGPVASRGALMDSFSDAMASLGLDTSGEIKDDGKWHYVSVDSKSKKNLSGSYILSLDGGRNGEAIGTIINRHTGEQFTWKNEGLLLTPEQKARLRADVLAREELAAREVAELQEVAAGHANEIWAVAEIATGNAYAIKKGVDVEGLRQVSGEVLLRFPEFHGESGSSIIRERENYLLVPMMNEAGELRAVQAISEDGAVKSFMRGAQKKGTMLVLGATSFNELIASGSPALAYSEGVATGASFRMASGLPVVVCFDAGNLETVVAQTAPKLLTDMLAVLAADNDQFHIERAIGFLSDKLGLNPHLLDGHVVNVLSGEDKTRKIVLGEAIPDGEWHQTSKGAYRMTVTNEEVGDAIRSVLVEVVPMGGRTIRSTFENRGLEAGRVALNTLEKSNVNAVMLVPTFTSLVGRPTDWNDLHKNAGLSSVSSALQLVEELELPGIVAEREIHGLERQRGRAMAIER